MTKKIRRKNFLASEGRSLATGLQGQLTAEEWLYLYGQIKDDLVGAQTDIFASLETNIRNRYKVLVMDTVAL